MLPFSGYGPIDRTERRALLFAFLFSCLFMVVFVFARPHPRRMTTSTDDFKVPRPVVPQTFPEPKLSSGDLLERFRVTPAHFEQIDFMSRSYGPYTLPDGTKIDLSLKHSQRPLPNHSGWFALNDVYYRDVTGDEIEEAIVWLSRVQCRGGSCNDGTYLFYIYTMRNGMLKPLWQYETGSYAQGCGLRSFTVSSKYLALALFGDCAQRAVGDPGEANFIAGGFTSILLEFDGRRFAEQSSEYYITPPTNLHGYEPTINIY
jgi:hypothetical protein